MNRSISKSADLNGSFKKHLSGCVSLGSFLIVRTILLIASILCFSACKQDAQQQENPAAVSLKTEAKTSGSQPLPGGKARFTWVNGNFDTNGYTWERIVNLTFTASTGTVGATLYTWDSTVKKGKEPFNSHTCTFDGVTQTCSTYTPGGWVYPAGQYVSWSGTYVYNTSTGRLDITWTSGATATESWTITNPTSTLARASLITSSYTLTHGRGYGSNASWSTFKTIDQIGRPTFSSTYSRRVYAGASTGTGTPTILPATGFNAWTTTAMDLSGFTTPSNPTPKNTIHFWDQASTACTPSSCNTNPHPGATGIIYHLSSLNTNRQMSYTNFCACLSTNSEFPCYPRNLHPSALMQIIDDNGDFVALVGIEAQNPKSGESGNPAYQFHLWDFNNIP